MCNDLLWMWQPGTPAPSVTSNPVTARSLIMGHTLINTSDFKAMPVEKQRFVFLPQEKEKRKDKNSKAPILSEGRSLLQSSLVAAYFCIAENFEVATIVLMLLIKTSYRTSAERLCLWLGGSSCLFLGGQTLQTQGGCLGACCPPSAFLIPCPTINDSLGSPGGTQLHGLPREAFALFPCTSSSFHPSSGVSTRPSPCLPSGDEDPSPAQEPPARIPVRPPCRSRFSLGSRENPITVPKAHGRFAAGR